MFYLFLVLVGIAGIGIYVLFIFNLVPGVQQERLGVLEPLPEDVGKWKPDDGTGSSGSDGLLRETRHYFYEATGKLVLQVRYKNRETGEIVRVEADEPVKRRRIRV